MTAQPVLMASLRPVAAAVQIEWSPRVIALTEGGLLYSATVYGAGRQAGRLWGTLFTILKVQDGFGLFNFLLFFFCVGGREVKLERFPSGTEKRH